MHLLYHTEKGEFYPRVLRRALQTNNPGEILLKNWNI